MLIVSVLVAFGMGVWHAELFTVSRTGERPMPLVLIPEAQRRLMHFNAVLPQVPVGMRRLEAGNGVLLVHYWAPWERDSRVQVVALDSLRRATGLEELSVVVVCFDPFPSVARFVGRNRLRLAVVLDGGHALSRQLPCPSVPYTYVLDRAGRIAVEHDGEIDWLDAETVRVLHEVLHEPGRPLGPGV